MSRYRGLSFLPDEDSIGLGTSIRHFRVLSYREVGLTRGASDEMVAKHARSHSAIVLTRNVRDFKYKMRDLARESSAGECAAGHCHEGGGLVTVAPALKGFHFERVTKSLRLAGHLIDWDDVFVLNLRVRVDAQEHVTLTMLPRCERCLPRHSNDCPRCHELDILRLYSETFERQGSGVPAG